MARVYIPGGPYYQQYETPMQTISEQVQVGSRPKYSFFGIPFGSEPVYETRNRDVEVRTATSPYGVNDTGRTLPFAPIPTFSNYQTINGPAKAPEWARGGSSQATYPANDMMRNFQDNGFFGGLLSLMLGNRQQPQQQPYQAALRERPRDIQALVSMSQRPGFAKEG